MNQEKKDIHEEVENKCIHCKVSINEKPWIIVNVDGNNICGCSYQCGIKLYQYIGPGYWDKVVNKEDFNEPRPVCSNNTRNDITTGFGMEEIRNEIEKENIRIEMIENSFEEDSSSEEYSDEEFY